MRNVICAGALDGLTHLGGVDIIAEGSAAIFHRSCDGDSAVSTAQIAEDIVFRYVGYFQHFGYHVGRCCYEDNIDCVVLFAFDSYLGCFRQGQQSFVSCGDANFAMVGGFGVQPYSDIVGYGCAWFGVQASEQAVVEDFVGQRDDFCGFGWNCDVFEGGGGGEECAGAAVETVAEVKQRESRGVGIVQFDLEDQSRVIDFRIDYLEGYYTRARLGVEFSGWFCFASCEENGRQYESRNGDSDSGHSIISISIMTTRTSVFERRFYTDIGAGSTAG